MRVRIHNHIQYKITSQNLKKRFSEPLAGSMIRPEKVRNFETVRDAIENRYILTPIEDDLNFDDFQMVIGAPLMEFVGVEKTWKKQR